MTGTQLNFIPIRDLIDSLPSSSFLPATQAQSFLDKIGIEDFDIEETKNVTKLKITLVFVNGIGFGVPGVKGLGLYFGSNGSVNKISIEADISNKYIVRLVDTAFKLRFSTDILKTVRQVNGRWQTDPKYPYAEIALKADLTVNHKGDLSVGGGNEFELKPVMIGDSRVVLQGKVALARLQRFSSRIRRFWSRA